MIAGRHPVCKRAKIQPQHVKLSGKAPLLHLNTWHRVKSYLIAISAICQAVSLHFFP